MPPPPHPIRFWLLFNKYIPSDIIKFFSVNVILARARVCEASCFLKWIENARPFLRSNLNQKCQLWWFILYLISELIGYLYFKLVVEWRNFSMQTSLKMIFLHFGLTLRNFLYLKYWNFEIIKWDKFTWDGKQAIFLTSTKSYEVGRKQGKIGLCKAKKRPTLRGKLCRGGFWFSTSGSPTCPKFLTHKEVVRTNF